MEQLIKKLAKNCKINGPDVDLALRDNRSIDSGIRVHPMIAQLVTPKTLLAALRDLAAGRADRHTKAAALFDLGNRSPTISDKLSLHQLAADAFGRPSEMDCEAAAAPGRPSEMDCASEAAAAPGRATCEAFAWRAYQTAIADSTRVRDEINERMRSGVAACANAYDHARAIARGLPVALPPPVAGELPMLVELAINFIAIRNYGVAASYAVVALQDPNIGPKARGTMLFYLARALEFGEPKEAHTARLLYHLATETSEHYLYHANLAQSYNRAFDRANAAAHAIKSLALNCDQPPICCIYGINTGRRFDRASVGVAHRWSQSCMIAGALSGAPRGARATDARIAHILEQAPAATRAFPESEGARWAVETIANSCGLGDYAGVEKAAIDLLTQPGIDVRSAKCSHHLFALSLIEWKVRGEYEVAHAVCAMVPTAPHRVFRAAMAAAMAAATAAATAATAAAKRAALDDHAAMVQLATMVIERNQILATTGIDIIPDMPSDIRESNAATRAAAMAVAAGPAAEPAADQIDVGLAEWMLLAARALNADHDTATVATRLLRADPNHFRAAIALGLVAEFHWRDGATAEALYQRVVRDCADERLRSECRNYLALLELRRARGVANARDADAQALLGREFSPVAASCAFAEPYELIAGAAGRLLARE